MRHQVTEQYLQKGQYKYTYVKHLSFDEIDLEASADNPARIARKLDEEMAIRYGLAMESGDEFPGIVLINKAVPSGKMKWEVATGMHRINGAQMAGKKGFDAYLVTEADLFRRETLIRQLNQLEGKGLTHQETLQHILHLHETFNKPLAQLSREWNVKVQTLQNAANERRARLRARRFGTDFDRQKVPPSSMIALNGIHSDIVFERAAELAAYTPGVRVDDVKDLVADIKKARTEGDQLAVVDKYKEEAENRIRAAQAQKGRTKSVAVVRVMRNVKALNNQLGRPFPELHVAAMEDKAGGVLVVKALLVNLERFITEIERADRMSKPPEAA